MPAMDIKEAREKMIARRFGGVAADSRTGGKGTARRKKKTMHKTASSDDKKIGATLKKLGCTAIPDIQEVNMRGPGVDSARPGRRRFAPARRKRPTEKKHTISRPRFTKEGEVIHFGQPRVQASIGANTFVVSGATDTKRLEQLMPGIMSQLGPENEPAIKKIQEMMGATGMSMGQMADPNRSNLEGSDDSDSDDGDIPELVEDFEAQAN
jgi:nascent polypeptide-associated complex subunit beta